MKKQYLFLLFLPLFTLFIQSCEERDFADGTLSPYMVLQDLRMIHKGSDISLTKDLMSGAEKLRGVVISDHSAGNAPEGMIVIQQDRNSIIHGIALNVGSIASNYNPGDEIIVHIADKMLRRNGFLYIDDIQQSDIEKIAEGVQAQTRTLTGNVAYQRPEEYEGTLVRIFNVQITPEPLPGETFDGTKQFFAGSDILNIHTSPTASFASMEVPSYVNVSGILMREPNQPERLVVWPRYDNNLVDVTDTPDASHLGPNPIIITGLCVDPWSSDANHEYIQLKANVDLNFAEVSFSVVTTNNATNNTPNAQQAPGAGWATGGQRTFKFNLTEGVVRKGEYFYVGSGHKLINGANSTSIADANWIRSFMYSSEGGDGFGDAGSPTGNNIMGNSGRVSGVGVFVGTNIAENTVPIDAVFYGNTTYVNSLVDIEGSLATKGYRIPNNDHYSMETEVNGILTPTPFVRMGPGMNDFKFEHHGYSSIPDNTGFFFKLGGEFNMTTREWITPRQQTVELLLPDSQLSQIEEGTGTTVQVD
ncbi:hypothetical protein G5B30_06565 [Sphingobacterium sp. SGG-5]|uniref:DUF5689 domain-containing protein n=1 Tax=Sphingobacterium sp. SGG-5 TaxID=2710881 RepID=UPI0013EC7B94|nr:DUF5689 domain-containing protein [Sphingobacterium sp. SGG-5]NGM61577.1 hypothetical protein [Sphingobacterium sp. SGG-5]